MSQARLVLQRNRLFPGWANIPDDCLAAFVDVHMLNTDMLSSCPRECSAERAAPRSVGTPRIEGEMMFMEFMDTYAQAIMPEGQVILGLQNFECRILGAVKG